MLDLVVTHQGVADTLGLLLSEAPLHTLMQLLSVNRVVHWWIREHLPGLRSWYSVDPWPCRCCGNVPGVRSDMKRSLTDRRLYRSQVLMRRFHHRYREFPGQTRRTSEHPRLETMGIGWAPGDYVRAWLMPVYTRKGSDRWVFADALVTDSARVSGLMQLVGPLLQCSSPDGPRLELDSCIVSEDPPETQCRLCCIL